MSMASCTTNFTRIGWLLAVAVGCIAAAIVAGPRVSAAPEPITLVSAGVESEFPEGMRFSVQVSGQNPIEEVAVRVRVGQQAREVYDYMEVEKATLVDSELFWRTNSLPRYIPPGTIITYYFEIGDDSGNTLETEPAEFIYYDARFTWEEVEDGPVAVAYHGPVKTRAEILLDATNQTLEVMGPLLGADISVPIRVTMYNNVKEMLDALPPGSTTIRRELITEGQAFTNFGTLLVLGGGRRAKGTASHEVTHILTHRAGDSVVRNVPSWLDEGLAEYGNIDPGFSYDIALEFAMATDRLLPITSMPALPGDPEDVIIFYGQARSIVQFMVAGYGHDAIRELMQTLSTGANIDDAIQGIYGVSRVELENQWRDTIGAPHYVPPQRGSAKPTPISRPAVQLFSLTPQAGSETVSTIESTPTPTPEPATPTPAPPPPTPAPPPTATAPPAVTKASSEQTPLASESGGTEQTSEGGSACSAPVGGSSGLTDLAIPLMALGLVGMSLRRRRG